MKINFMLIASILGGLAVLIGAFGVHGLEPLVDKKALQIFHTGVEYQFYHVLALLFVGLLQNFNSSKLLRFSGLLFIMGIFLFSGSLYAYVLTGIRQFGMITPLGGLAFVFAWGLLAFSIPKSDFSE